MNESDAARIAASFEADPELLPHLPYLFQDLPSLGGSPTYIVALARRAGARPGCRVADLCCGKGDAAIAIARATGCHVHGVDLFGALVSIAREAAERAGVSDCCTFEAGDVLSITGLAGFDGVVFTAASPALGEVRDTVAKLRACVRPGGWMIIEDGIFGSVSPRRRTTDRSRQDSSPDASRALSFFGDVVETQIIVPQRERRRFHEANTAAIRRRARELALQFPNRADLLLRYPELQARRNAEADRSRSTLWLLRRSAGD